MMARQSKMAAPNAPRIAPTAMKTVPSGAVDLCIYGASEVGGTVAAGYVGMDVSTLVAPLALLSVGMSEAALVLVVRAGIEVVEVAESSLLLLLDEVVVSLVEVVESLDVVVSLLLVLVEVVLSDVAVVSDAVVVSVALVAVVSAAMTPAEKRASARTVDSSSVRCRGERDDLILSSFEWLPGGSLERQRKGGGRPWMGPDNVNPNERIRRR